MAIQIRIYRAGHHALRIAGSRPVRLLDSDAGNAGDDNRRRGNGREHVASQSATGTRERLVLSAVCS